VLLLVTCCVAERHCVRVHGDGASCTCSGRLTE
jgi:hypothetical protein